MAQVSITQLPQAQALTGAESVPIVQNGVTVQTTTGAISGAGALNYPFLTVGSTVGLTDARQIAAGTGLSLTDGGAGSTLQINLTGAALSLDSSGAGIQVKTGPNTLIPRQITVGGGMTLSNGDGVSGDPLIGLNTNLQNLSALSGIGLMTINGTTFSQTTLLGTANQVTVANGNASGGNPTISLASNPVLPGTGGVLVPVGTSGQRIDTNGVFRYNTTTSRFEGYQAGAWVNMGLGDGTVTSVSGTAGQIGVTSPTSTPVISIVPNAVLPGTGSLVLPQGTTAERSASSFGALRYNTDTGSLEAYTIGIGWGAIISGAGVSTFTAGVTGLTPSSPTSGGIVLGGILNPASGGTGVNNGSYTTTLGGNVSTAGSFTTSGAFSLVLTATGNTSVTLPTTGTLATLAGAETLTNKTISGASNTLTNIGNSSLSNSSVTYNGVTVALGASGTITANTANAATFNNSGSGDASGTTFNGSAAKTISYNTVGASPLAGSTSLTTVGTITTGVWNGTAIGNSYLANSSVTIGTTAISLGASSLTLGGLTSVAVTQDPVSALQLATKQYVDAVAEGLHVHAACAAATTGTLASITGGSVTYNNGTAGVGATLTLGVALTVLDGYTLQNGDRVLVKNEATQANNGIYTWATGGTVLTRATDFDTSTEIASGDFTFITNGTLYANTGWVQTNPVTTVGTDPIVFIQFSGAGTYTAGTGLTLTGSQFSITNTGVSASTYGSSSSVPVIAVNAQGQITSASNSSISINGNQITSGTVGSSYISGSYTGITGVGTLTAGTWNATPIGNAYLANSSITVNGSSISLGGSATITANTTNSLTFDNSGTGSASGTVFNGGTAYTISYNTVGASPLAGSSSITTVGTIGSGTWQGTAIGVGYGGTGLTSYTTGDLLYASGTTTLAKLALGTTNYVLTAGGSAPQYVAQSTLSVGSATNATNATNVALTASSTNADYYLPLATGATTNNYGLLVSTGPTVNPSTGKITNGISGGTF